MSVMLTGGAGFIGLNIAERLISEGQDVVLYGLEAPPNGFMPALGDNSDRLSVVLGDVRDRESLLAAMAQHKVKKLVHGAAVTAGLEREAREPQVIVGVNLGGTIEVLEAALQHGIQRVVQLGSGAIFGSCVKQDGMLDEDTDIPVPDSLYGISKYAAERTGLRYRQTRGLDLVIARLGTCFGRWEYDTGVRDTLSIPLHLTRLAEEGRHAVLYRELPNDWVYATDVADAVCRLLGAPSLSRPLFNLSAGQKWSAMDWCERLAEIYPGFSFEVTDDRSAANVGVSAPTPRPPFSIERLKAEVGYAPGFLEAAAMADYVAWRNSSVAVL